MAAIGFVSRPRTRKRGTWRISTVWRTRVTGGSAPCSRRHPGGRGREEEVAHQPRVRREEDGGRVAAEGGGAPDPDDQPHHEERQEVAPVERRQREVVPVERRRRMKPLLEGHGRHDAEECPVEVDRRLHDRRPLEGERQVVGRLSQRVHDEEEHEERPPVAQERAEPAEGRRHQQEAGDDRLLGDVERHLDPEGAQVDHRQDGQRDDGEARRHRVPRRRDGRTSRPAHAPLACAIVFGRRHSILVAGRIHPARRWPGRSVPNPSREEPWTATRGWCTPAGIRSGNRG